MEVENGGEAVDVSRLEDLRGLCSSCMFDATWENDPFGKLGA
jgi:hypothetical protein